MKKLWNNVEVIVDRSVPYALLLLLILIIAELFFAEKIENFSLYVTVIDFIIIGIFVADLVFKYMRSRNIPNFLKTYWLEIIAVFPAFLFIRFIEELVLITNLEETVLLSQESLEIGERVGTKSSRTHYFARFIRPLARLPRFLKAFKFYERPHHFI